MMRIQLQLVLTACVVNFVFTQVRFQDQVADSNNVNNEGEIRENFQDLLNSIAKNDTKKREIYREVLKQEVAREQQAFDTIKGELWITQHRNAYRKRNFYKRINDNGNVVARKRETDENNDEAAHRASPPKVATADEIDAAFKAAEGNNFKLVKTFIEEKGVPANATNKMGQTIAHIAATIGHREMLKYIMDAAPDVRTAKDCNQITITELVIERKAMDALDLIKESYSLTKCYPEFGIPALQIAIRYGQIKTVKYLVSWMHCDVDARGEFEKPPAFVAIQHKQLPIFLFLVEEANANLTLLDAHGSNILFEIVGVNDLDTLKYVLDKKKVPLDVNSRNLFADTILHRVVFLNLLPIVKYLVAEKGADVNLVGGNRMTPLHLAAYKNHPQIYEYLIERGANVALVDFEGKTAAQRLEEAKLFESFRTTNNTAARARRSLPSPSSVDGQGQSRNRQNGINAALSPTTNLLLLGRGAENFPIEMYLK